MNFNLSFEPIELICWLAGIDNIPFYRGCCRKITWCVGRKKIVSGLPVLDGSPMDGVLEVFVKLK